MACEHCTAPDGESCYPIYGLAPHAHFGKQAIATTRFLPRAEWPSNFRPDSENAYHGVWWCSYCGEGKPADKSDNS